MRIYLAARYGRHEELMGYAEELRALGYQVTSRWILGDHELRSGGHSDEDAWAVVWAAEDRLDLLEADIVVSFTEGADVPGRARGGRHVEFGMALERGKRLIVVGPRENVFHYLPLVRRFETWAEARDHLAEYREGTLTKLATTTALAFGLGRMLRAAHAALVGGGGSYDPEARDETEALLATYERWERRGHEGWERWRERGEP